MAEVINMPRLSDTMEEGTVAKWLKKKGDQVEEGDILAEIETDKATMEFESFYEGTLLHIAVEEGESAPVDSLLAIVGEEGEDIDSLINGDSGDDKKEKSSNDQDENDNQDEDDDQDDEKEKTEKSEEDQQDESEDADDKSDNDSDEEDETPDEIPEDVEIINMPRLSDTMEEGTLSSWVKKEGDEVEDGDILAEIETDKATMEFESFYDGVLLKTIIDEGESTPVDQPIAVIGPEGTDVSKVMKTLKSGGGKKKSDKKGKRSSKEEKSSDKKESPSSKESQGKASSESKKEKKEQKSGDDNGRIFASPLAKRMAADKGIDLSKLEGSGDNGRIIKRDIENYKPAEKTAEQSTAAEAYVPAGEESFEEIKNSQMRKTIAKRLSASKFNAPHYYLTVEVNMDQAMASRKSINAMPDTKISFNDLVIKASAMALRKHPRVNSQWHDEAIKVARHIHIGAAVAVEDGLVVPVLRFADQMSMTQIGAKVKELAGKARDKKIQPKEMEGSTFTVSNLGMFGIQEFTSIINQPNTAILSVGAIEEKPVVRDGEITVGHTMKLTMACDHRVVDGATGSKFLQTLQTYLENPVTMLA